MSYCPNCRLFVSGSRSRCPLCQGDLCATDRQPPFPPLKSRETFPRVPDLFKQHNLFLRFLVFLSVAASVISLAVNYLLPTQIWWSLFVVFGIACVWISLSLAIKKRRNLPKNILWQVFLAAVLSLLWDLATGWHRWSLDYFLPILFTLAIVSMWVTARILNLRAGDYLVYLCIDILFAILPAVCIFAGALRVLLPSIICVVGSILSLAALLIFEGENMRRELRRKLHL